MTMATLFALTRLMPQILTRLCWLHYIQIHTTLQTTAFDMYQFTLHADALTLRLIATRALDAAM